MRRWPPDELRRVARLARRRQTEVISTHMSRAHLFGVLLRWMTGIPCVATAHSCKFQPHWMFNDYVIAVSEATRRYHVRFNRVRRSRIETVFNFVDPRWTSRVCEDARARVRAEFGVDDSSPLIGTVGWLIPRKGQIYLIRALPKILRAAPAAKLVAIGGAGRRGKYLPRVQNEAERLGVADHFIWAGVRDDMEQLYPALDLLVHPALEEPMGRVLMEAMAAGVPVVTSDVTGTSECVADGQTGLLVPPRDPDALAEATIALLRDPERRRQFGEAGVRRVEEEFSPESQVARTEAIFRRAALRRKAA
jgi:glycosyltransferase involved in cell wall biosynthesis